MRNTLWTVLQKELVDLFRDRRTVAISLVLSPLLMPMMVTGIGMLATNRADTQTLKPLELPVVGAERAPTLIAFLKSQNVEVLPPPEDPDEAIRSQRRDVVLRVGETFGEDWRESTPATVEVIYDSSQTDAEIPVDRLERLLEAYGSQVGALRLLARGVSPSAATPLRVARRDLITPTSRAARALAMLPYMLILLSFIGASWFVIDTTSGERERQSLEPLLATPSHRGAIMSGKILAACTFNLLVLAVTLAFFKASFALNPELGVKVDVSLGTILTLMLVMTPTVLFGSCLLTFIAAGVKSVKEAQSYLSMLILLPMVPTLVLMVNPVKNQLWMFATPFLAPNQLVMKLLRGEPVSGPEWLVFFGAGYALGAVLWVAAARRYHDERLAISA